MLMHAHRRGFLGWGNVSTLGLSLAAALEVKLAYPEHQCVNVTGDIGVSYMMGNFEAVSRYGLGVTTIHINCGAVSIRVGASLPNHGCVGASYKKH